MTRTISVQCCFATYTSSTVQIQVQDDETLDTALNRAIEEANFTDGWKKLDYEGPIFIAAASKGASPDPSASPEPIEVPYPLTERGQMQIDIPPDALAPNEPPDDKPHADAGTTTLTPVITRPLA